MKTFISALALLAGTSSGVPAAVLPLDGDWQSFLFEDVGSSWDRAFTFSVGGQAYVQVTDAFLSGDRFEYTVGPVSIKTSVPTSSGVQIGDDFDTAFALSDWSSGEVKVSAGDYILSGIAIDSPFGSGEGAVRLSTTSLGEPGGSGTASPVPLPASAWLLAGALGLIAGGKRLRRG